jgi:malonyl CoA-acyl carrier protein transacylase
MKNKRAVVFAGIDALDAEADRQKVLRVPEVRMRLLQAQHYLLSNTDCRDELVKFLATPDSVFNANLPLKAMVSSIVQVGLYDQYRSVFPEPEFLMGISLGDTARTVCSGAVTFEELIYGTYLFNKGGQNINGGAIVCAKTSHPVLTQEVIHEIEKAGLFIAVHQTPQHFLISGSIEILKTWSQTIAPSLGLKIRMLYDKPLHSADMAPAMLAVRDAFAKTTSKPWSTTLVSSIYKKIITSEPELRSDIETNMIGTVYWWQTYKWMVEELGVREFVNIGPAKTLLRFMDRIPVNRDVLTFDSLELATASSSFEKQSFFAK